MDICTGGRLNRFMTVEDRQMEAQRKMGSYADKQTETE